MLEGFTNKVSLPLVFLSACGWITYLVGFSLRYQQLNTNGSHNSVVTSSYFSYWCFGVSGVPLYFFSFFYLLCGNIVTGLLVVACIPLFLVSLGGVLNSDGQYLYNYYTFGRPDMDYNDYIVVEFAGTLEAVLLYWVTLLMWIFWTYRTFSKQSRQRQGYERLS